MSDTAPSAGKIVFVDRGQPPLQAGGYEITVNHAVSNTSVADPQAPDYIADTFTDTRRFAVRGERFTLDPGELLAVFPPKNCLGEYAQVLPHAVFQRSTLPWERAPDLAAKGASWLAVLVFDAAEAPPLQTIQAGDLQRASFRRASTDTADQPSVLPADTASYGDAFPLVGQAEVFQLDYGESWSDPCQAIDIPTSLFNAICPSLEDLEWLAHVRTVDAASKATGDDAEQTNAVVVGNRRPHASATSVAHLVSLEGMAGLLPRQPDHGAYAAPSALGGFAKVRLLSLTNWSFTSVDPAETFTGYLEQVSVGSLQRLPADPPPQPPPPEAVTNAFRLGYTAMNHQTRLADSAVSWIRGPLLPFATTADIVPAPGEHGGVAITAADQAVRFDPATGMADVTYAAAWQIGRMAALADASFASTLYNFKRTAQMVTMTAVQQRQLTTSFTAFLGPHAAKAPVAAAAPPAGVISASGLRAAFMSLLLSDLAPHLATPSAKGAR